MQAMKIDQPGHIPELKHTLPTDPARSACVAGACEVDSDAAIAHGPCDRPSEVLVVDDTPENLSLLAILLEREGYIVRKARNGRAALQQIQIRQPDLILLDIMMPEMDGYSTCEALKSHPDHARIPIIFLSALDGTFDKVRAFTVGAADFINKPFEVEEVLIRVRNQLQLQAKEREVCALNATLEARVRERTQQLQEANRRLLHMAMHDDLTSLPNRTLLLQRIEAALSQVQQDPSRQFAVLFLDCDRFKLVNDSLGHSIGDRLLVAMGQRLQGLLGQDDTLARLGGDEFAMFLASAQTLEAARDVAQAALDSLARPFLIEGRRVFVSTSIGVAVGGNHYHQAEHLLRDADIAMYRAKASGQGRYQIFDPPMHAQILDRLHLETDLRRAANMGAIIPFYQPLVCLKTNRVAGFEVLARWHHPQRGWIRPDIFVEIAEEIGILRQIDAAMLAAACRDLRSWRSRGSAAAEMFISVNLSPREFASPDVVERICDPIAAAGVPYHCIKLEITERCPVDDHEAVALLLAAFREKGIQICLDDFGTGYSSLSYLSQLPIDVVKIDRSCTVTLNANDARRSLAGAIATLANTLQMKVVAEGVETEMQVQQLRNLDCHFGQGYVFAKPMAASEAEALLLNQPSWDTLGMGNGS
ncbi:MAG: hypothetical protein Fur0042_11340 [Cyanophyceae cyanobacterium]